TIVATYKNDRDVAVGNLIGSSITNVLVILGLTCLAAQSIDVSNDILFIDLPLAAVVAIVCYPVFRSDRMVSRTEGVLFVTLYLLYIAWLLIFRM
ncbi:MAG: sodium:calcium antiporter, partial [Chitinophagaceae bacterium]